MSSVQRERRRAQAVSLASELGVDVDLPCADARDVADAIRSAALAVWVRL